ncbi:MAG TPA: hypothetical protein VNX68_12850 [Nitrosopumilaceae archaeon]|jgi:hypothetical protein|nr:hypothetical protein [Nitrosopumilaceae archaeon]
MEIINLRVTQNSKDDVTIEYSPNTMSKNEFTCKLWELKKFYLIETISDLSPNLIRRIIRDNYFEVVKTTSFDSKVVSIKNKRGDYSFQIEDSLVCITQIKDRQELFVSKDQISNYWTFKPKNWDKLKESKKKLTPLTNNMVTSDSDFNFIPTNE